MAFGIETWRVYSAEQSIDSGPRFADIAEVRAFVRRVRRAAWTRERFGDVGPVTTRLGGLEEGGRYVSFARQNRQFLPERHTVSLHPTMLQPVIVLHELAHCFTALYYGDLDELRRDRVVYGQRGEHDYMFTATLSLLVERFGTGDNHADLADAYRHFGVQIATEDELLAAREHSRLVETEAARIHEEIARRSQEVEAERQARIEAGEDLPQLRVPRMVWGDWAWLARRGFTASGRTRTSLKALSEQVSRVERCTSKDIHRIEAMEQPPTDARDRRRAMAMVAALQIDPIWARTGLGLVRWDCAIELEELRLVNPAWADTVDELNELLEARQPRWAIEGDR